MQSKKLIFIVVLAVTASTSFAQSMCPNGQLVSGNRGCLMCPDGSFIPAGGACTVTPNGEIVSGTGVMRNSSGGIVSLDSRSYTPKPGPTPEMLQRAYAPPQYAQPAAATAPAMREKPTSWVDEMRQRKDARLEADRVLPRRNTDENNTTPRMIMCPGGTWVSGTRCVMTPDGRWIGR